MWSRTYFADLAERVASSALGGVADVPNTTLLARCLTTWTFDPGGYFEVRANSYNEAFDIADGVATYSFGIAVTRIVDTPSVPLPS